MGSAATHECLLLASGLSFNRHKQGAEGGVAAIHAHPLLGAACWARGRGGGGVCPRVAAVAFMERWPYESACLWGLSFKDIATCKWVQRAAPADCFAVEVCCTSALCCWCASRHTRDVSLRIPDAVAWCTPKRTCLWGSLLGLPAACWCHVYRAAGASAPLQIATHQILCAQQGVLPARGQSTGCLSVRLQGPASCLH